MNPIVLESNSPAESLALGEALGRNLVGRLMIGLVGPLGAGKTHFVKGIALGNGAPDARVVTSPTFTLIQEYAGRLTLYHIDVYRLGDVRELVALGLDEMVRDDSVIVIEWADRVRGVLSPPFLELTIESTGPESRRFSIIAEGEAARDCAAALSSKMR